MRKNIPHINFTLLLCLFQCIAGYGQLKIDTSITLTGTSAVEQKISHLGSVYNGSNIVRVKEGQNNQLNFLTVSGSNMLSGSTSLELNSLLVGARFDVKIDTNNTGPVTLSINGSADIPVLKNISEALIPNDLIGGMMISVIYDGSAFQLLTTHCKTCPSGFTEVHKNLCIETDENPVLFFWDAVVDCKTKGAKLCTWGQWYYACQKSGLGLLNMTNNNEWLNQPVNNPNQMLIQGNGGCQIGYVAPASTVTYSYRCCYIK